MGLIKRNGHTYPTDDPLGSGENYYCIIAVTGAWDCTEDIVQTVRHNGVTYTADTKYTVEAGNKIKLTLNKVRKSKEHPYYPDELVVVVETRKPGTVAKKKVKNSLVKEDVTPSRKKVAKKKAPAVKKKT